MEDTVNKKREEQVIALAQAIQAQKGQHTIALDLRELNSWTDFFIITTVTSSTHSGGMQKMIKDFMKAADLETLHSHKGDSEDEWNLVDGGFFVVHLMSKRCREFFELEKLMFQAKVIFESKD
jgi:ribosome-associated protein